MTKDDDMEQTKPVSLAVDDRPENLLALETIVDCLDAER